MKIDHIALYCTDLEEMRSFFMKQFGCSSNEQYCNLRTGLRTYILTFLDGGSRLELMTRPEVMENVADIHRHGYIHMSVAVGSRDEVDRQTAVLAASGHECISGPRVTGDCYYESCIVGPEGILIEITE